MSEKGSAEPLSVNTSLMDRCPFRILLQDQVSTEPQMLKTRRHASGREPQSKKTSNENSVKSLPVRSGLQEVANDFRVLKHTSRTKGRMLHGPARTAPGAKTASAQRRSLKDDHVSIRRYRNNAQDNGCGQSPVDNGPETELTQTGSDPSTQAAPRRRQSSFRSVQSTRKPDTEDIDVATESVDDLPEYTLDNVRLTEMELETCKRLDSLARNRQRTAGRPTNPSVAKDQNVPSPDQTPPDIEAKTGLPKDTLESTDFETEHGIALECSGDQMARLTYRSSGGIKPSITGEQTGACVSSEPETVDEDQAKRVKGSSSNGLTADETDLHTTEENNLRLKSVIKSLKRYIPRRSTTQISDPCHSFSSRETKVEAQDANTRNQNKLSSAYLQDASTSAPKNISSSYSSGSSCCDSCSQTSLATATFGTARRLEALATSADRTCGEDKRNDQGTYRAEEPLNARKASCANIKDKSSVLSADLDSGDATSDHKTSPCEEVSTQFEVDHLSSDLTGNAKKTLHSQTKETTSVLKRKQISGKSHNPSQQKTQTKPPRPVRSSTITIEPSTADNGKDPDLVADHTPGFSKTSSPRSNEHTLGCTQLTLRLQDDKLTGTSTFASSTKNTISPTCKPMKSLRNPSPTKSSALRQHLRLPVPCHACISNRQRSARDRDRIGATLSTGSTLGNGHVGHDSYARLQRAQSIPVKFRLKEICREIDGDNGRINIESGSSKYSLKYSIQTDSGVFAKDRTTASCVSEASRDTSTSTDIMTASPSSGGTRIISTRSDNKTDFCISKDPGIPSAKRTVGCCPQQMIKHDEISETSFYIDDPCDIDMKASRDQTVSYWGQKGRLSPPLHYLGGQGKPFQSTTRTFLVSSPGQMHSQLHQHHPTKHTRRSPPKNVPNPKRTFLVGQSCLKMLPRNYNTTGSTPKRFRSLSRTFSRAHCQTTTSTNGEQQLEEIPRKSNHPRDTNCSPPNNPQSSVTAYTGNRVTCLYSDHPPERHSDKITPCQNTHVSPHIYSNCSVQAHQFCSTPVLGSSIRPRSPLFFSPIPVFPSPKRRASLAKWHKHSPNMSYTICSSPITPSDLDHTQNPQPHNAFPLYSYKESPEADDVIDGSKKARTKENPPLDHTELKNQKYSGYVIRVHSAKDSSSDKSSTFNKSTLKSCEPDVFDTDQSSSATPKTQENSSLSLTCIFYRNHSQAVDATLPNGRRSKIPQAYWQPFHVIPAATDVTSFRLRIHSDEVPPRSFRYSKYHRRAIEERLPDCIRHLPDKFKIKRTTEAKHQTQIRV